MKRYKAKLFSIEVKLCAADIHTVDWNRERVKSKRIKTEMSMAISQQERCLFGMGWFCGERKKKRIAIESYETIRRRDHCRCAYVHKVRIYCSF